MMTNKERLIEALKDGRVVRYCDLDTLHKEGPIPKMTLWRLIQANYVVPEAGGFRMENTSNLSHERFVQLSVRHPQGVLCLYTALKIAAEMDGLDLTDEVSITDTVGVPRGVSHHSSAGERVVTWSNPEMLTRGVEVIDLGGNLVRRTTPERTVADMFRPSHNVAEGDALSALRKLAVARREGSLSLVHGHAEALGWGGHVKAHAQAVREMLASMPRPKTPPARKSSGFAP